MKLQRPNIKINKTWLMLAVAIVLSLLTAWLTLQYLTFKEKSIEAEVSARSQQNKGATITVVVPTRALPPGAMLEENVVASREVPADFFFEDMITVAQFDALKGHALLRQVERGKPLRKSDVREIFADFSGTLKAGKRAITINVDEINSVSHMVEPGNLVDLMLVLSGSGDGSNNQTVVPFLDQVRVLATGQKITQDDPASQVSQERRRVSYSNVTLEVTPTEAARLTLAVELGKIRAVLRNENDRQSIDYESVNASNLLDDIREREKRIALKKPRTFAAASSATSSATSGYVEYIIGGKGSGSDTVAPTINIPMPAGLLPMQPGAQAPSAANSSAAARPQLPQNLTDLIRLSQESNPANAKSSK